MKRHNISKYILRFAACALLSVTAGCTNLDEELYDRITSENFLQTRDDVTRDFLRAFEHSYWSIQGGSTFMLQENSSDEMMTINRQGDWFDGGHFFICKTDPNSNVELKGDKPFKTKSGVFGIWLHYGLVTLKKL